MPVALLISVIPQLIARPSYGLTTDEQISKYRKSWLQTNKYQITSHILFTLFEKYDKLFIYARISKHVGEQPIVRFVI